AGRHVLNGGRDATFDAIVRDEAALRWARKTGPNPCWFCAMLASRGPVYHSRFSASRKGEDAPSVRRGTGVFGEMFHDHCQCTVVPVFSMDDEWPDRGREFEAAWKELSQILGRSPTAQEWRKVYNERYGQNEERVPRPIPVRGFLCPRWASFITWRKVCLERLLPLSATLPLPTAQTQKWLRTISTRLPRRMDRVTRTPRRRPSTRTVLSPRSPK